MKPIKRLDILTINDAINKRTFEVSIPGYYKPVVPGCIRDGTVKPPWAGDDTYYYSRVTIPTILDMICNRVPFNIIKEDALIEIVELLEEFRKVNAPYTEVEEMNLFMKNVNDGLAILTPRYEKLVKRQIAEQKRKAPPVRSLMDWMQNRYREPDQKG